MTDWLKRSSAAVPYIAVIIGLYWFKNAWLALGLYHLGIAMFVISDDPKSLLKKVFRGWNSLMAGLTVLMSVMIFPVVFYLWGYMELDGKPLDQAVADLGLSGASWILFMIFFSTVQPLLEELYWRGYLKNESKVPVWSDFAFGGYHILVLAWFIKTPWLVAAFFAITAAGYIWRFLTKKYNGMLVPLVSHIVADITIIAVTYALINC